MLRLAAVGEAATGLALLVSPVIVVRLLLGAGLAGLAGRDDLAAAGIIIGRGLGVACWPGRTALCGMLTYSLLATGSIAGQRPRDSVRSPLPEPAVDKRMEGDSV